MIDLPYNFIRGKNESDMFEKLTKLALTTGFTFKIISIYPRGKGVIAWYYASKKT